MIQSGERRLTQLPGDLIGRGHDGGPPPPPAPPGARRARLPDRAPSPPTAGPLTPSTSCPATTSPSSPATSIAPRPPRTRVTRSSTRPYPGGAVVTTAPPTNAAPPWRHVAR